MPKAISVKTPTQEKLKDMLKYNKDTGIFVWNYQRGRAKAGSIAQCLDKDGYIRIGIDNRRYQAHRLAILYVHGYYPENEIDHINRDKSDNRICNLREVSRSRNARNTNIQRNNSTGIKGVHIHKRDGKFCARVSSGSKSISLGHFSTLLEAAKARLDGEKRYGYYKCNSESSAYQYILSHSRLV